MAVSLHNSDQDTTVPIRGELRLDGEDFEYEVYLMPILGDDEVTVKQDLIKRLGGRMQNGKHCLNIDETVVSTNIEKGDYTAIAFIKNKHYDDTASGTLQYYDWCNLTRQQMWINDLCRISTNKQAASPVKALLKVFELITIRYTKGLRFINLMVDNENREQAQILISIYGKYGFEIIKRQACRTDDPANKYTLMRKRLDRSLPPKSKKSRTSRGGRKTRIKK